MEIEVLRLSHRLPRDERISTHVALVARAFGASSITYTGQHDSGLEDSVKRICGRWGGKAAGSGPEGASMSESGFAIRYEKSAIPFIKQKKREGFTVVHLSMYGLPVQDAVAGIRERDRILLVVGSEAVPGQIYQLADFNVAVTSQPHSEVAALAIALDRIMQGKELEKRDFGGQVHIVPSARGKNVKRS